MSLNYTASPLTSNETLLEQFHKIVKLLEENPLYKVYLYLGEYESNKSVYDKNLVNLKEGEVLSKHDIIIFTNSYFAEVESTDTDTFTIITAYSFSNSTSTGSTVYVNKVKQDRIDFIEQPQTQIDKLKVSIAQNVDGIARVEQQKQDKLPQVDLDNIAKINELPTKAEVNSLSMCPSSTITEFKPTFDSNNETTFIPTANGYLNIQFYTDKYIIGSVKTPANIYYTFNPISFSNIVVLNCPVIKGEKYKIKYNSDVKANNAYYTLIHAKEI